MHAGAAVDREAVMLTSSGTHFGISIEECKPARECWVVHVDAAGADLAVRDELEDVRGAQLGSAAVGVERIVDGLESLGCT